MLLDHDTMLLSACAAWLCSTAALGLVSCCCDAAVRGGGRICRALAGNTHQRQVWNGSTTCASADCSPYTLTMSTSSAAATSATAPKRLPSPNSTKGTPMLQLEQAGLMARNLAVDPKDNVLKVQIRCTATNHCDQSWYYNSTVPAVRPLAHLRSSHPTSEIPAAIVKKEEGRKLFKYLQDAFADVNAQFEHDRLDDEYLARLTGGRGSPWDC